MRSRAPAFVPCAPPRRQLPTPFPPWYAPVSVPLSRRHATTGSTRLRSLVSLDDHNIAHRCILPKPFRLYIFSRFITGKGGRIIRKFNHYVVTASAAFFHDEGASAHKKSRLVFCEGFR